MTAGPPVVDLNADVGEDPAGGDAVLLEVVTSVHVACGFHAGGPELMQRLVAAAVEAGVAVGAHPSYPDAANFGRLAMDRPPGRVAEDVLYQVGALQAIARANGAEVVSVKAHGALYHRIAGDAECAAAVAGAVAALDADLALVLPAEPTGPPGAALAGRSAVDAVVRAAGLAVWGEAFCDRAYRDDGTLVPRPEPGAVITEPAEAARRARCLVVEGTVTADDGTRLHLRPDTLCVHGDTPGALDIARQVRRELEAAGVVVGAPLRTPGTAPGPR